MNRLMTFMTFFLLAGCAGAQDTDYRNYLATKKVPPSSKTMLYHCHGYGCRLVSAVNLSKKDWKAITAPMRKPSKTAAQERMKLRDVIGLFEQKVGTIAGTQNDRGGTFAEMGNLQLDCVDESVNTTTYLSILQQEKLLKHHSIHPPESRAPFGSWPHQTAVIKENESGRLYAVDSWFHDNGLPAEIVALEIWKDRYSPEKTTTGDADGKKDKRQ